MNERYAVPTNEVVMNAAQQEPLEQIVGGTNGLLGDLWNMLGEIKNALYAELPGERPVPPEKAPVCIGSGAVLARMMVRACCDEAMTILRGLKG